MRILARTIFPIALLVVFTAVPALAQTKIATVDLKKVFDNYYKTKLATQAVQERADDLDKDYTSMATDLKKRSDQYQQILASASDQAVSQDERDKRRQSADDLFKQLQESKAAIEQFERQAQVTISDQRQRMRDNILAEIKKTVADKAKSAKATLVLDTAAQTINGTPSVVYTDGSDDLTDDVLKQLNASAPPDLPQPSGPSVFMSTNTLPYSDTPGGATPSSP